MSLPSSGQVGLDQVNVELGLSSTAQIDMNGAGLRGLFGIASGQIAMSDGYAKSSSVGSGTMTAGSTFSTYTYHGYANAASLTPAIGSISWASFPAFAGSATSATLVFISDGSTINTLQFGFISTPASTPSYDPGGWSTLTIAGRTLSRSGFYKNVTTGRWGYQFYSLGTGLIAASGSYPFTIA
jgi:hypothetical protein